jgi:hypothetical protein
MERGFAQVNADRRNVHAMILQCVLLFDHPTSG